MNDDANLFGVKPKAKRKAAPPAPGSAVQRLIGIWVALFEAKFKEKPIITPRDGAAVKRLVAHAGADAVERRLPRFLDLEDAFIAGEGYPLALLQGAWNKLIVRDRETKGRVPDASATRKYLTGLNGGRGA